MSTPNTKQVTSNYTARSEVVTESNRSQVTLALDSGRGQVGLHGRVRSPALFRDALATAAAILASDLRYRGKDRTAYLAYLMKQGKKANAQIWEAQKQFLDESLAGEKRTESVLDPVLTVDPDQVSLEVFSRDESAYARLAFDNSLFEDRAAAHGSSFVDMPSELLGDIDRLRTYVPLEVDADVAPRSRKKGETKAVEVPYSWLRGFLQVQSAATLPSVHCELAPIDLYNVLFALRTRKAKKAPRALRFELIPGLSPRLVLEPWEIVLECHGPKFQGSHPQVVRTFGRQRLMALQRLLPHTQRVRAQLLGPGLPVFWAIDLGQASLTLGLTGWSESGWSSAASFDALMPGANASELADATLKLLKQKGPQSFAEITAALKEPNDRMRAALQVSCLRGQVLFDLSKEQYRPRSLLADPVDEKVIRFGNVREERAHRLLGDGTAGTGEVKLTKVHEMAGEGTEIQGEVVDKEAVRTFLPRFTIDLEERVTDASCGCPHYRRSGLREGPCEHMIALRLAYSRQRAQEELLRQSPEGRKLIRAETRTYVRRDAKGQEMVYRVSLDDRLVVVQWGPRTTEARAQRLWFDTDREAREAYFARLESLSKEGFIDAITGPA
jgi:predicted DNA-binding WGR domain protein